MYILDIIPLSLIPRNMPQIFSYFHNELLKTGMVVEIDVNHRKIKGIVVGGGSIKSRKLDFKKMADFELKKIAKVVSSETLVSRFQLETAHYLSNCYYAPLGLCLKTILPPFWNKKKYDFTWPNEFPNEKEKNDSIFLKTSDYLKIISEQINSGKQVFLMVPEVLSAKYYISKLESFKPELITSGLKIKQCYGAWQNIASGKAKLIIGTRVGLFLPFKDLGYIIIDDESNEAYKSDMTPRYNSPEVAKFIAGYYGAKLAYSAIFPKVETIHDLGINYLDINSKKIKLVNMVDEIKAANFSIFSRELKDELKALNGKIILYVPRRGHANYILCGLCGSTIKCPNCDVSLILHKKIILGKPIEILMCHHCQTGLDMPKACPVCGGYRLKAKGIGIEKAEDELVKFYKTAGIKAPEILRMDSDLIKSEEQEEKIIKKFKIESPVILLTTQLLFSHKYSLSELTQKPTTGIISADSLINIPDFRSEESLFRQLVMLYHLSDKLILQTYNPADPAIDYFSKGIVPDFINYELGNRKQLNYPPFSSLTKLTYRHLNENQAKRGSFIVTEKIRQIIKQNKIDIEVIGPSQGFISKEKSLFIWNILLKNKGEEIKTRNEILRVVPSKGWTIDVNPKSAI